MLLRLISRLGSWFGPGPLAAARTGSMVEPLEDRVAPATLISTHIVTYTDIDGDLVTIHSSKPLFVKANVNSILTFSTGTVVTTGTDTTPQQLQLINLTAVDSKIVTGDNISVTATKAPGGHGDGLANVGFIESNVALGNVQVQGDLGRITAGSVGAGSKNYIGLKSLTVNSIGAEGTTTQGTGGSLLTSIYGGIGSITIQTNLDGTQGSAGAQISAVSNTASAVNNANIGSIKIGGSILGGSHSLDGSITAAGNVNSIVIGGDLQGGAGQNSASLQIGGKIGSLSVDNIIGYTAVGDTTGLGAGSASIITGTQITTAGIGSITVTGNVVGGDGLGSAFIGENSPGNSPFVKSPFGKVKIGGALTGGTGDYSAQISANSFGSISIGAGIAGSSGVNSGSITSVNGIASLTIGANSTTGDAIKGGTANNAGSVVAATNPSNAAVIGTAVIHGDITGDASAANTVTGTGQISTSASIGTLTLNGSLIGSTAPGSGSIMSTEAISSVSISGQVLGGGSVVTSGTGASETATVTGTDSGRVVASGAIGKISVGKGITGGDGASSGQISAGSIGTLTVGGQILGAGTSYTVGTSPTPKTSGTDSGTVVTTGNLGSATIGQGIVGGIGTGSGAIDVGTGYGAHLSSLNITTDGIMGGAGTNSGQVNVGGTVGSVNLHGAAITASTGAGSGALIATDSISTVSLGSLVIVSGAGTGAGEISTGGNLTTLTFTGTTGTSTTDTGLVSVSGSAGSISVHGDVAGATSSTVVNMVTQVSTIADTGLFLIGGGVKSFVITGALTGTNANGGNSGSDTGSIFAGLDDVGVIGSLTISGGVIGGSGDGSGEVFSGGGITKASVGDLIGGAGQASGSIVSDYALGAITVTGTGAGVTTHGIIGGSGVDSGQVSAGTTLKSLVVKGSLQGGSNTGSGAILSHSVFSASGDIQGDIGSISITGSVIGSTGVNSGQIAAAGNIKTLSITGNVTGALASGTGGIIAGTDLTTSSGGDITTLKIAGTLSGADVPAGQPGSINGTGYIEAGHIGTAVIGAIQAGSVGVGTVNPVTMDGAILAANDIASLTVTGSITGTASNPVIISAVGQLNPGKTDLAFGKISVGQDTNKQSVTYTNFLAGYDQSGAPVNGAASIGSVTVAGNWSESNLVAGVIAGLVPNTSNTTAFGQGTDKLIATSSSVIPTIASIIIKGHVTTLAGVTDSADTFGFVAKTIDAFSVAGTKPSLKAGLIDPVDLSTDTDLRFVTSLS
jgi:hypothetical protein